MFINHKRFLSQQEKIHQIQLAVKDALVKAFVTLQDLGEKGKELIQVKSYADRTLVADWTAEEAVLDSLRARNILIRVIAEEHGVVTIGNTPQFLGVLDGLDGTNPYRNELGRYGTMFAIYEGVDPTYDDYLACGIVDHVQGEIYLTNKGQGTFAQNLKTGESRKITASEKIELKAEVKICIDGYPFPGSPNLEYVNKLEEFKPFVGTPANSGASAVYYMDLSSGRADLVIECTRKKNLEIAVAYGLVKEAGGVMVDEKGKSIGSQKYFDFGQKPDEHILVITAATIELVQDLIAYLKKTSPSNPL